MRQTTHRSPLSSTLLALLSFALLLALAAAAASASGARRGWGGSFNVSVGHGDDDPRDCSDIRITSDRVVVTDEERHSFAVSSTPISIRPSTNSGLSVTAGDGREVEVIVCKAALGDNEAEARTNLDSVVVETGPAKLVARGPRRDDGLAWVIVRAPRGASLDLAIDNGPLSVRGVEGKLSIHGQNGPVSLRDVSGDIEVELENGPASLTGGAGSIRIHTENGPIDIDLGIGEWRGEGLEASAVNGPLSVTLDDAYRGSLRVESSGHAPWDCGGPCRRADKDWNGDDRWVTFGSAPYKVRLSTENGPISIDGR